ncbi:MAG: AlwI family type II restriction endonuclease [Micrococcaceae bacterium]
MLKLIEFKTYKKFDNFTALQEVAKDSKIKKAFGEGSAVFCTAKTVGDFLAKNKNNALLSEDNSLIYKQFQLSKKNDIVREYRDMTKRTFNLTGLIDFSNGQVNAWNQKLFNAIFDDIEIAGVDRYFHYEKELNSDFYNDVSIADILALDPNKVVFQLKKQFGANSMEEVGKQIAEQKEEKLQDLISKEFTKEKVLEILPLFSTREDAKIKKLVSESASVPTIYEYIMAIAWFHISSEDFKITESLNLTLDGNMRPLSHAVGGDGDIIINYPNLALMLEVTLMNSQAQRRGEWEPVLRHATNLTVEKSPRKVITLFIADDLDENTINIWRAVASMPMKATSGKGYSRSVKIFPLVNEQIIKMLSNNIVEAELLTGIEESCEEIAESFDQNWRQKILNKATL